MSEEAAESVAYWREQAARCRRLADRILDKDAMAALLTMAQEYEDRAAQMGAASGPPPAKMELPPQ